MEVSKTINNSEPDQDLLKNKNLLIVEDDDIGFSLLQEIFGDYGLNIQRARDGAEAIEYFRKNNSAFDLVLMDLRLPNINGFKATSVIKEINPLVPVFAVTAYVHSQSISDSYRCGCDEFIAKPFDIKHLILTVQEYLSVSVQLDQ
ncbi:MAG: response regulator [Bacteroidales bacterium]|jgi:CheY-like chemotaxis protein|nr:response regulator [Bacteroidales bacterium]